MKSPHEICGCLDGVRCRQAADRDRLMGMVNSAENRARLAEDRERVVRQLALSLIPDKDAHRQCCGDCAYRDALAVLDAQEPRT